ncbi:MAG: SIR2 family protein [Planctomycetes bacterium]|nr:SIR2 family protein [Planctomycetota bacterium]
MTKILLTGAGFSADFGGFLKPEMWTNFYNNKNLDGIKWLKKDLFGRENYDYEGFYQDALVKPEFRDYKAKVISAMREIYQMLDQSISYWLSRNYYGNEKDDLIQWPMSFLIQFDLIFTLNQDLLLERLFGYKSPLLQDNTAYYEWLNENKGKTLKTHQSLSLPTSASIENAKQSIDSRSHTNYLKLHGSHGWFSSRGNECMVVGLNKKSEIDKEPLLKTYFDLFTNVLKSKNAKLVLVGYGFGDQHINTILINSVKDSGLKICNIDLFSPRKRHEQFFKSSSSQYPLSTLIEGFDRYYPSNFRMAMMKYRDNVHRWLDEN